MNKNFDVFLFQNRHKLKKRLLVLKTFFKIATNWNGFGEFEKHTNCENNQV